MTENPYDPPAAELKDDLKLKRSIWWKIYFFFITIMSSLGMMSYLVVDGSGIAEYISLIGFIIATVGLFGFCFLKQILYPRFWMIFLVLYIAYGFIYIYITNVDIKMGMPDLLFYISWVIGIAISLPAYYAIFSYGRPGNKIWKNT